MSYTEFHKGKFKIIAKGDEEIINFAKANNLVDKFYLTVKDGKIVDHDCYDRKEGDYNILTLNRHKDNEMHVLIQYVKHYCGDVSEEDIDDFQQVSQNEFEFYTQFYNGGCCETEIFEDHLSKIDLNAPFNKDSDTIEISPRESYMVVDCFKYVLSCMDKEKIDYLFCNYSKDEIAKFAQQFCNLNSKNNW